MSANVDLVRSIYAEWERGDFSSAEWADPEIEFLWADGLSGVTWKGPAALADATREWLRVWAGFRFQADEYRELDEERVLVLGHFRGSGKASGLDADEMRAAGAHLFQLRDGKVLRLRFYGERKHALADLGLAGEGGSQR